MWMRSYSVRLGTYEKGRDGGRARAQMPEVRVQQEEQTALCTGRYVASQLNVGFWAARRRARNKRRLRRWKNEVVVHAALRRVCFWLWHGHGVVDCRGRAHDGRRTGLVRRIAPPTAARGIKTRRVGWWPTRNTSRGTRRLCAPVAGRARRGCSVAAPLLEYGRLLFFSRLVTRERARGPVSQNHKQTRDPPGVRSRSGSGTSPLVFVAAAAKTSRDGTHSVGGPLTTIPHRTTCFLQPLPFKTMLSSDGLARQLEPPPPVAATDDEGPAPRANQPGRRARGAAGRRALAAGRNTCCRSAPPPPPPAK